MDQSCILVKSRGESTVTEARGITFTDKAVTGFRGPGIRMVLAERIGLDPKRAATSSVVLTSHRGWASRDPAMPTEIHKRHIFCSSTSVVLKKPEKYVAINTKSELNWLEKDSAAGKNYQGKTRNR